MYGKISAFVSNYQEKLNESEKKIEKYRKAYIELAKSYSDLLKNPPVYLWLALFYGYVIWFILMGYLY